MRYLWLIPFLICTASILPYAVADDDWRMQWSSGIETGNRFFEKCGDATGEITCRAYVLGFADGLQWASKQVPFCASEGVTGRQIFDVVVNYVKAHPESRHLSTAILIQRSLEAAFPCKQAVYK